MWAVFLLIALLVLLIVFIIVMYECYRRQLFIFAPYTPPVPPGFIEPVVPVTTLDSDAASLREQFIESALFQ